MAATEENDVHLVLWKLRLIARSKFTLAKNIKIKIRLEMVWKDSVKFWRFPQLCPSQHAPFQAMLNLDDEYVTLFFLRGVWQSLPSEIPAQLAGQ